MLGVYGYGPMIPGHTGGHTPEAVLFIEDTSDDIRDQGHALFNQRAHAYALAYNRALADVKP
jgi:hypothetical protein